MFRNGKQYGIPLVQTRNVGIRRILGDGFHHPPSLTGFMRSQERSIMLLFPSSCVGADIDVDSYGLVHIQHQLYDGWQMHRMVMGQ